MDGFVALRRFAGWRDQSNVTISNVMVRALTLLLMSLVAGAWLSSAAIAEPEPCRDCNPKTGLTIREQIKADRAREADRIA